VHDLRHTIGRRLRAAGVALETRQAILGHKSGSITTHSSAAELRELRRRWNTLPPTTSASRTH
jgi:integrase